MRQLASLSTWPFRRFSWSRGYTLRDNAWICKPCSSRIAFQPRFSSTGASVEKPYYITTPIFYVNAAPHVGHFYTLVLTDILKRWQQLRNRKAILCTGTDEHGLKIQQAAKLAKCEPREFCDRGAEIFKDLARQAEVSNDHFIRTSDADHAETVRYCWHMLQESGHIYESKHEGWYCVSDETFYPESALEKRLDPFNGRTFLASAETGKEVEWTSERNYHFRLSAFKNKLLEFYAANPDFVVPKARMNDVVKWVSDGLEDLSISRPRTRLTWGISVPGDDSQVIYVWLDALINYITKAGYPWAPGQSHAGGWPADVQVIGKDIVRFHCIYWPAFLMALDLPPPKQILTHAHWTLGRQKMAKSTGNVVNPFFAISRFGVDVMRYYLAHDGGIADDADYSNFFIVDRYKSDLKNGLGNLVSRLTRPKLWSVHAAVEAARDGQLGMADKFTERQIPRLENISRIANEKFKVLLPGQALRTIMDLAYSTNTYLSERKPWEVAKGNEAGAEEDVNRTIYYSAEAVRITGILLQPFMPGKSAQILDMLGVDPSRRTFDHAQLGADYEYGSAKIPVGRDAWDSLFPPLILED